MCESNFVFEKDMVEYNENKCNCYKFLALLMT